MMICMALAGDRLAPGSKLLLVSSFLALIEAIETALYHSLMMHLSGVAGILPASCVDTMELKDG